MASHGPIELPDDLTDELPPSALFVYVALRTEQPQRTTELAEWTGMPPSTVRAALRRLRDREIVCSMEWPKDGQRGTAYLLVDGVR